MNFDYFYGGQANQFNFIKIPRDLLTESIFDELSLSAKVLYGVLLDRMSLSMKNGWFDKENKPFIIYQISEIQVDLKLSKRKAMDCLRELEKIGLVEKKKRGFGLPNILYVKNFVVPRDCTRNIQNDISVEKIGSRSAENGTSDTQEDDSRGAEICTSEVAETVPLEVPKPIPLKNKTNISYTYRSKTEADLILSGQKKEYDEIGEDEEKKVLACQNVVKKNIEYDALIRNFPMDRELIEGIYEMIVETVLCEGKYILIAQNQYPVQLVKSKFMKLNFSHIEYVINCFKKNTTEIRNIKKYLLAALFNAPSTIDSYYKAAVNHDLYGGR